MTFLSKLFSSKLNTQRSHELGGGKYPNSGTTLQVENAFIDNPLIEQTTMTETTTQQNPYFKELFVDTTPPTPGVKNSDKEPRRLVNFLAQNFHSMGVKDGFEYHSSEALSTAKSKIKADFYFIIDQAIDEKLSRRLECKNKLVDVAMLPEVSFKLENTLTELELAIEKLHTQKELSVDNEGWIMKALHAYHQGFMLGINDWLAGEDLLNSIKNL